MSDLSEKLAERLSRAVRFEATQDPYRGESWNVVADTIQVMIDKAILEAEQHAMLRMQNFIDGVRGSAP